MGTDETMDLFPTRPTRRVDPRAPLADRMRPACFDEMIGQEELVGEGTALRSMVESGDMPSVILWGPPGSGKTTLAWLLAAAKDTRMTALSAVVSGVKEIREAVETARRTTLRTLLFIDEIHRLNRAQQDVLLPHVEAGTVTLIGATTENPSFTVNAPLLSRSRVLTLKPLDAAALERVVGRAVADDERGLGKSGLVLPAETRRAIVDFADGDARKALGLLEAAAAIHLRSEDRTAPLAPETVREAAGKKLLLYDRDREEHYNIISALIKSLRSSDPDAALYYLARMLEGGEDPLFIARRLLIFASEDVGNADPWALTLATSTHQAVERLGMPEARITLGQATTYLACAIKSNASYAALNEAQALVERTGNLAVPMHLRNAPTRLMKQQGYGEGYHYPHDADDHFVPDRNLPEELGDVELYRPGEQGAEAALSARLREWRQRRRGE
jgi:putative ATPase